MARATEAVNRILARTRGGEKAAALSVCREAMEGDDIDVFRVAFEFTDKKTIVQDLVGDAISKNATRIAAYLISNNAVVSPTDSATPEITKIIENMYD